MDRSPSVYAALAHWARHTPDAPFVVEAETGQTLSYGACRDAVRGLRQWLGAAPRTIALALPGGRASAVAWLAALTGGHTLVPCSPEATDEEKARLAGRYAPDVLIVEHPEAARGFDRAGRVLTLEQIEADLPRWTAEPAGDDRTLPPHSGTLCLTTSGTTGTPKGVRLRADQIAWAADQIRLSHRLTPADRGLAVLPFFHINAPVVSLCATLLAGATVVIAPRFSRRRFWDWIARERITWASIVPTIVARLLQSEGPAWIPGTLRFVRTASAPLPVAHLEAFERRFGIPVVETYGLSEAASTVAANPVPPGRRKPGTVGLAAGVRLRVCEPCGGPEPCALRDVAPGAEGEICVAGPSVIAAYDGGAGARSFQDGWFRTGDLGRLDADGYLTITGRMGDVINRGGEKIAPREVEEVLLAHPAVRDAAVVGRPHPDYGQQPVAYVVPRRAGGAKLAEALRAYCAGRLSAYKVPARFVEVETLPRTRTGKIQRHLVGVEPVADAPAAGLRAEGMVHGDD